MTTPPKPNCRKPFTGAVRDCGLTLALWLWASFALAAERGAPLLQVYDLQETISATNVSSQVYSLPDGRLFLSTTGGPAIFDGVRWQVLRHPRRLGGFNDTELAADGRIFGGFNGDIGYWKELVRGHWDWHSLEARLPAAERNIDVLRGIALQGGGSLQWFVTPAQLIRLEDAGAVATLHGKQSLIGGWMVGDEFWVQDALGQLYRANASGPLALTAIPGAAEALGADDSGRGYFIRHIVADDGDWRILLTDARILSFRDGQFREWPYAARELLSKQRVLKLTRMSSDRWVIVSTVHGPMILAGDGSVLHDLGSADGIPLRPTYDAFEDHQGGLWLAQERALVRVDLGTGITQFGEAQGLPGGIEQLRRWQGDLYAIGGNYLYRLVAGTELAPAHFERVAGDQLRSVIGMAGAGERLLVASAGLHEWQPDSGQIRPLPAMATTVSLTESAHQPGRYWLGHQGGLSQLNLNGTGDPVATPTPLPWAAWLTLETDADTLWVADYSGHLARLRLDADPPVLREFGVDDGLPGGAVKIHARHGGGLWVSTLAGIMEYDATSDHFHSPGALPIELRSGRVFTLLDDPDGNLWVRGDGLDAVAWRRGEHYELDLTVLRALSNKPTTFAFLREGNIVWLARASGVARIDLGQRHALPPARAPLLSTISTEQDLLDPSALTTLGADQRELTLRFGSGDWHRSDALSFRSQLAGFDREFSAWSKLAERSYTNLPHGNFEFRLESRDGYGRISAASPVPIRIAAPWYLSAPALLAWVAAAGWMLVLAARLGASRRQRSLLLRQRELEHEVALRTEKIAHQNEQLQVQADRLQQQAERLAQIDQLKTQFFVNVGHEFRTPLTLVMGPIDDVLREPSMRIGARARDLLELAQRNARRVLDLIIELLDVNKLEQGQLPLKLTPLDLGSWLPQQLGEQRALIERHGHELQLSIADQPLVAAVDPLQLARAVGNLVTNAAKYMARGGEIHIALGAADGRATLSVCDQGRGIAAADLPHVFDRFYRVDEAEVGGHGVGLALAREIVERHGGNIDVSSELGVGSRFSICLPLLAATAAALPAAVPPAAAVEPPDPGNHDPRERPRVLVVDDHADLRLRLRQLLSARYEVIEASDGPSAQEAARTQLPDVIVADVMMPGFDGVELTRRLRADADTAAIGILLLTAKAGADHAVVGLTAGADDYLAKPFDATELLARVEAQLAQMRRLQARLARQVGGPPEPAPGPADPAEARWRERLELQITAHLHDPAFNVEVLAQAMHLDRSALFRKLKQLGELAPAELLRERRLVHAEQLLHKGAGSVSEIAYAVGFENLSSFTRAFRARFACAPSSLLPTNAARRQV